MWQLAMVSSAQLSALAVSAATTGGANFMVPPTKDGGLYFSEHNWAMESIAGAPVAVSVNAGAYVKAAFSGSTRASFALEATKPSPSQGETPSTHYINVVYSIDNKPWVEVP